MSDDNGQGKLFDVQPDWKDQWVGMPEYDHRNLEPWRSIKVHFRNEDDWQAFSRLVEQRLPIGQNSIWYPKAEIGHYADKRYATESKIGPRYPIYIVSKGRWEKRATSDHLHKMGVSHFIVVEENERDFYLSNVSRSAFVLVLDPAYQRDYDTFDELGETKSKGPGPARNFAWNHAIAAGATSHWVMDDNINGFFYFQNNLKTPVADGAIFRAMEDFVDRYSNIAMSGPNYFKFVTRKSGTIRPFTLNTRIYSCNLIRNDAPFRWRGRYNEDTDLSLRMLKAGFCTVQFNAFLQDKQTTQTMKGGNTAEFYAKEGTLAKSKMQVAMHPDVSTLVEKWGRWHHHVDYRGFRRNKLVLKEGVEIPEGSDDYGMKLHVLNLESGEERDPQEMDDNEELDAASEPEEIATQPDVQPDVQPAPPPADIPAEVLAPSVGIGRSKTCLDCGAPLPPQYKYRCEACIEIETAKRAEAK